MNDIETVFTTLFRLKSTFAEKRIIVRPKSATLTSLSGSNLPSDALLDNVHLNEAGHVMASEKYENFLKENS